MKVGGYLESTDELGRTPLILAVSGGFTKTLQALVKAGGNIEAKDPLGQAPLLCLSSRPLNNGPQPKRGDLMQFLLENGTDVEVEDDEGRTALYWAELYQDEAHIKLLKSWSKKRKQKASSY